MYKSSLHSYRAFILFYEVTIHVSSVQQLIVEVDKTTVLFKEIVALKELKKIYIITFKICDY
jgi:hypothetical protein